MSKKIALIGHDQFYNTEEENRLKKAIQQQIDLGCKCFTMGVHGKFDSLALSVCRRCRSENKDIEIVVVITSFGQIKPYVDESIFGKNVYRPYEDVETVMYDIEEVYYKKRVTESNKQMLDSCDTLICFVDPKAYKSGAKTAMNYAKRKGLNIINLYKEKN